MMADYHKWLSRIKSRIQRAQIKAAISVNREMLNLYWDIGKMIVKKQSISGWGDFIIEKISKDLKKNILI